MSSFATPFAYLPPDILFIIANFVDPDVQDDHNLDYKRPFLNLTGVCRRWRSAFLSFPSLWTRIQIPERSVRYLEETLTRSAEYPLNVTVYYYSECSASKIAEHSSILLTHLHRIQSLVIYQGYGYHAPIPSILSLISKPVPMLEMFRYECQRISFRRLISIAQESIPKNLFADHAPKLKEFHISRVILCHNLPIFKTITRLSLKHVYGLTHSQLLDILETASLNLEFLEISSPANFILPSEASDSNNRPAILLSSLRTLVLKVRIQVFLLVLNRTNIPRDIDWKIDFSELIVNVSLDLTPFVSFLTKVRKGPHAFFTVCEEYIGIKFKQTPSGPYNSALELEIDEIDADSDDTQLRRLESILASLELSNVLSCELVCTTRFFFWMEMYNQVFQSLFFLLDRTEKLSISCDDSDQLDPFVHHLWPQNAQDTISIPCPLLNDLKVGLVNSTTIGSLVQGLALRREAGHVLTKLCVEYENHLESHTTIKQDLMKLVQNVEMIEKVTLNCDSSNIFLTQYL